MNEATSRDNARDRPLLWANNDSDFVYANYHKEKELLHSISTLKNFSAANNLSACKVYVLDNSFSESDNK